MCAAPILQADPNHNFVGFVPLSANRSSDQLEQAVSYNPILIILRLPGVPLVLFEAHVAVILKAIESFLCFFELRDITHKADAPTGTIPYCSSIRHRCLKVGW